MSVTSKTTLIEFDEGWSAAQYREGACADGQVPVLAQADWFDAVVPGALQYDLIRHGKLGNPYASSKAVEEAEWVHQCDWVYRLPFVLGPDCADGSALFLELDGVDTFAEFWLNGVSLGVTANAYRAYRLPIARALLRDGENELVVHMKAHKRMVEHMVPEAKKRLGGSFKYKALIRRYQRSFFAGSSLLNLGGEVLGIGLYMPLRIVAEPARRIEDVHFKVVDVARNRAYVDVDIQLNHAGEGVLVNASLFDLDSGACVSETENVVDGKELTAQLTVANPKLWWPKGYGAPNRYRLRVDLIIAGKVVSSCEKLVGLRTSRIETRAANGRETYQLVINDVPIYIRGHNIVPVDYIQVHGPWDVLERLLDLTLDSNSNMLRIWGGGGIEEQRFYDACDARGIMIWQDAYLHSTTYPDYDEDWVAEIAQETRQLYTLLRNNPSFVVACGGNEQWEGWDEWGWRAQLDQFYGSTLPLETFRDVAAEVCPELPYVVNSPHGGGSCQTPYTGDVHNWGNFYNSTKDPLLVTETCWSQQSYSRADTLERVMDINMDDYTGLGWPEKWRDLTGLDLVQRLPYTGGPLEVGSLRSYIKGLELEQGLADHHALTNLIMRSPSCNGLLYWPLNKGGPLFQFGCVDYDGHPLASYYVVKRLFADQVVTIYRDMDDIRVIAANRSLEPFVGTLRISHLKADGTMVNVWHHEVSIAAQVTERLADIAGYYENIVDRTSEVIQAELLDGDQLVSEEILFFVPLMDFVATPDTLSVRASNVSENVWDVEITSTSLVKMLMLDGNQKYLASENYFTLAPNKMRKIRLTLLERMNGDRAVLSVTAMDSAERHEIFLR